jgi:ABC-type amino acid transport substrate-binding protein
VDDTLAVETEAKRIGAWEKLRSAGQLGTPQNIYAAFANTPRNKNAKIYSKDLADGVTKLRKNGTYARILSKYKAAR